MDDALVKDFLDAENALELADEEIRKTSERTHPEELRSGVRMTTELLKVYEPKEKTYFDKYMAQRQLENFKDLEKTKIRMMYYGLYSIVWNARSRLERAKAKYSEFLRRHENAEQEREDLSNYETDLFPIARVERHNRRVDKAERSFLPFEEWQQMEDVERDVFPLHRFDIPRLRLVSKQKRRRSSKRSKNQSRRRV